MPWAFPPSPQQQMSLLAGKKCSLPSPPHFPFPGKAQGNKIKSSIITFYIENALEFELWIQMVLKESTRGALNAARWQGSHAGEPAPIASDSEITAGGSCLFPIQQHTSHTDLQFKVFLAFLKLGFVFREMPCPGLTQKSH